MKVGLSLSQEQKQTLSAAQIQSLKLLAMDNLELCEKMQEEYLENPLLEYEARHSAIPIENGYITQDESHQELRSQDHPIHKWFASQLDIRQYSRVEWKALLFLIDSLDDNGYLPLTCGEAASLCRLPEQTLQRLIQDLQHTEPCGVFARDLQECLLIQLRARPQPDPLAEALVSGHLEQLARGDIRSAAKELSVTPAQVRKALAVIAQLQPRPLNGMADSGCTSYVVPDLLLCWNKERQIFEASINDEWYADYRISDHYLQMLRQTSDSQLREYFEKKYLRAKSLLEGIEQRRKTLLDLCNYVGRTQAGYLLGREQKLPLTMTQAAADLGISVSTVSRAVKDKYIQTPAGCTAFKSFFEAPALREMNADLSRDQIKETLKQLIDQEDKNAPLSDAELVERLAEQGIVLSRRTVAKYRDSLGIKGCFDRRQF